MSKNKPFYPPRGKMVYPHRYKKYAFCIYLQGAFFYTFPHSMVPTGLGVIPISELFEDIYSKIFCYELVPL